MHVIQIRDIKSVSFIFSVNFSFIQSKTADIIFFREKLTKKITDNGSETYFIRSLNLFFFPPTFVSKAMRVTLGSHWYLLLI